MDPAIAVRLALDAPIGRLNYRKRTGGILLAGKMERFCVQIQLVQRTISLFIGTMKLRESGVANKQLSALPKSDEPANLTRYLEAKAAS